MSETIIALDTETYLIGPEAIAPRLVCYSYHINGEDEARIVATVDKGAEETLREFLESDYRLVLHNASFDLAVISEYYPHFEPLIWAKLDRRQISDTRIREQLLNLSTIGKLEETILPDGGVKRLSYSLAALLMRRFGIDVSADKEGDDIWRLNYDKLDGVPAVKYPADAARYAKEDATHTLNVYFSQEEDVQSETGHASLATETFHTAADFALMRITMAGMAIDADRYYEVKADLDAQLTPEKMAPLIDAGILRPEIPEMPHKKDLNKAADLLSRWLNISPDDVDWTRVDEGMRQALLDSGFKFKKGVKSSVNQKLLKDRVLAANLRKHGVEPKGDLLTQHEDNAIEYVQTATGGICANSEVIADLHTHDVAEPEHDQSPLTCYKGRKELEKMVTTELPRLLWEGKPADRIHFPYKVLLETARTSSYATKLYPSANGQNVDPRARPIFVPSKGHLLCSADYAALELVCVAQTTYDLFGESVHRDRINAGYDLHAYLGSVLARNLDSEFPQNLHGRGIYEWFLDRKGDGTPYFKFWRKLAKPTGLGFSSGLGPKTMVDHARKDPYNIDLEELALQKVAENPDYFEPTPSVYHHAKNLFGMDGDSFGWNKTLYGIAMADKLRSIWLEAYPEMKEYFAWVKRQKDGDYPYGDEDSSFLCYTTPMGMHRAGCIYTAAVNGRALQSPGAEGFKHAVIRLVRAFRDKSFGSELYGKGQVVNEIHDEMLSELLLDEAPELALLVAKEMELGMAEVIRDVKVTVEACLMDRWYKYAEPVFDENGRLAIWTPDE